MSRTFLIFGVKRTGNHAIIRWLMPQMTEAVRFYNDHQYFVFKNTDYDERILDEQILAIWRNNIYLNDAKLRARDSFLDKYVDVDNVISFEGVSIEKVFEGKTEWLKIFNDRIADAYNPRIKINEDVDYILLLRNPWNFVASQIKWRDERKNFDRVDKDIVVWNEYYDLYLNNDKPNVHFIIYDKWFTNINYRKQISKDLGLNFSDKNLNKVAKMGGGSSFNKMEYEGKAQEMKVLDRYKQMMHNQRMLDFIASDKAKELKEKWNHLCIKEKLGKLKIN